MSICKLIARRKLIETLFIRRNWLYNRGCCRLSSFDSSSSSTTTATTSSFAGAATHPPPSSPNTDEDAKYLSAYIQEKMGGIDSDMQQLRVMRWIESEKAFVAEEISRSKLCQVAGVPARDLRKVLSVSKRKQISSILVRKRCLIVHMEHIKALVLHDQMFLFDVEDEDSSVGELIAVMPSFLYTPENAPSPFELRALECILLLATEAIDISLKFLTPVVHSLIGSLSEDQGARKMKEFMAIIESVNVLHRRALSLRLALTDVLNNDEDLAAMFLTEKAGGKVRDTQDHQEAETLLENYLLQVDETEQRIQFLRDQLQNQENFLKIHFDSQRNRLMRMNLLASFGAVSASLTAAGSSLFGMNLLNTFEQHPHAFFVVSGSLCSIGLVAFLAMLRAYSKSKTTGNILSDRARDLRRHHQLSSSSSSSSSSHQHHLHPNQQQLQQLQHYNGYHKQKNQTNFDSQQQQQQYQYLYNTSKPNNGYTWRWFLNLVSRQTPKRR